MAFKILLINPPYKKNRGFNREGRCTQEASFWSTPWPPYSLASLASILRSEHSVKILDCPAQGINFATLESRLNRGTFDVIVAALSTETIQEDLLLLRGIKEKYKTQIVVFGIHPTVFPEEMLNGGFIDYVVLHEPEGAVRELVSVLAAGGDPAQVNGIFYRTAEGEIVPTKARDFIENLDSLPFPSWDLVDLGRYRLPFVGRKFIIINTIRGCSFHCSFCNAQSYYGSAIRSRSVPSLLAEIRQGIEQHHVKDIFFWGDTFTLIRKQVQELCHEIINARLDVHWVANSRVDTVDRETLVLMKRAGCWLLSYGIESGDDDILKRCGKNITRRQVVEAVKMTRDAGIMTAGHFIFGLPGETETTARNTIAFARKLNPDFINFYTAVPYPGSRLYEEALRDGWIRNAPWAQFNQNMFLMELPKISNARLSKIKKHAYASFYLSPKRLKTALALACLKLCVSRPQRLGKRDPLTVKEAVPKP